MHVAVRLAAYTTVKYIILLFDQQTKLSYSLLKSRNFHTNQRKIEKQKLPTTVITIKINLKYPCASLKITHQCHYKKLNITYNLAMYKLQTYTIILLFGEQIEPPHSLSRSRNSHVNRRKIEKLKLPTTVIMIKISLKYPCD